MTTPFRILTLGVGDAFSSRFYHTSFVLMAEGSHLLIDCPEPIRKILREASESVGEAVRIEDIDNILLTHLHADHASGFETICHFKRHFEDNGRANLFTSPEVLEVLWENRLSAVLGESIDPETGEKKQNRPEDYYSAHALRYDAENTIGPFQISIRRTRHVIPTVGVIARVGDLSVGYACDTIFDRDHIDWLSQCNMIIHECGNGPHTGLSDLLSLPEEIKAKMWLVHFADDFDVDGSPLKCLRQGQIYTVAESKMLNTT